MRKVIALLVACGMFAQAAVQITWEELAGVVVSQRISVLAPDGTRLEGEVLAVRPDSLVIDVLKTSRKAAYPSGQRELPRAGITEIRVIRHRNAFFRVLGTFLGAVGGLGVAAAIAEEADSAAPVLIGLLVLIPVCAAAGYYAGKLADRGSTLIQIRSDAAGAIGEVAP